MLTHQEISDRLEIQEVLARYADSVDRQDLDLLDDVFTADADLDYTDVRRGRGDRAHVRAFLADLPERGTYYHMLGLPAIAVDGDTAETRTPCFNPMPRDGGAVFSLWYRDGWVRTDVGWRICRRRLELCFRAPLPRS